MSEGSQKLMKMNVHDGKQGWAPTIYKWDFLTPYKWPINRVDLPGADSYPSHLSMGWTSELENGPQKETSSVIFFWPPFSTEPWEKVYNVPIMQRLDFY